MFGFHVLFSRCTTETCDYYFSLPVKTNAVNCPKCKKPINLSKSVNLMKWCENQYDLAFMELTQNQPQKAVEILCKAIDIFHR